MWVQKLTGIYFNGRGVYYDDVPLFKKQENVSRIVDRLEAYFEVPSSHFNLTPANKGLFAGPIAYSLRTQDSRRYESNPFIASGGTLQNDGMYTWGVIWKEILDDDDAFIYKEELIIDTFRIQDLLTRDAIAKINWVMVIEKETCFTDRVQKMNRSIENQSSELQRHGHGILITVSSVSVEWN